MKIWILICEASRTAVHEADQLEGKWQQVKQLVHPASREKSSELSPSEPGHSQKSKGDPHRSSFEPHQSPHEVEAQHFAEQVAHYLKSAVNQHKFEQLVLVAPPRFLGLIRQHLDKEVSKRLLAEIDQDYTALREDELKRRVNERVQQELESRKK